MGEDIDDIYLSQHRSERCLHTGFFRGWMYLIFVLGLSIQSQHHQICRDSCKLDSSHWPVFVECKKSGLQSGVIISGVYSRV